MQIQEKNGCVIFLMGATAVGKTKLAIELAQYFPCDIINVDSMMVYRGLDIGTAKPTIEEQKKAPHRLIDVCEPWEYYSVARFCVDAKREISDSLSRQRIPLLVGGTMMYFDRLINGLHHLPPTDSKIRKQLSYDLEMHGLAHLYKQLTEVDTETALRVHANDAQRIMRALEVYQATGKPLSSYLKGTKPEQPSYHIVHLALLPKDRTTLRQCISDRFDQMLEQGFISEVKRCLDNPHIHDNLPAMRAVGYRQIWQYLCGEIKKTEMREKAITATCRFAKRQETWLRHWPDLHVVQKETALAFISKLREFRNLELRNKPRRY